MENSHIKSRSNSSFTHSGAGFLAAAFIFNLKKTPQSVPKLLKRLLPGDEKSIYSVIKINK